MDRLSNQGVEIQGAVPQNVVSSILSRSDEFQSNGRSGWTLAKTSEGGNTPDENGKAEAFPETGEVGAPTPAPLWNPSNQSVHR